MITRNIISTDFVYKSNEYNNRYGFPEEGIKTYTELCDRIDFWKYTFKKVFLLERGDKVCFAFSHSCIDAIAVLFAAAELSFIIIPVDQCKSNIKLFLHSLPDTDIIFQTVSAKSSLVYHHVDLADVVYNDYDLIKKYSDIMPTQDTMLFPNITHEQVASLINERVDITGSLLHLRYYFNFDSIINLLKSLQTNPTFHTCLGYYILKEAAPKILTLIQELKIDNVLLNDVEEKQYINSTNSILNKSISYDIVDDIITIGEDKIDKLTIDLIPNKFSIDGKIVVDEKNLKFYFVFYTRMKDGIADIKVNILNNELKKYTNYKIESHKFLVNRDLQDADLLVYFRD